MLIKTFLEMYLAIVVTLSIRANLQVSNDELMQLYEKALVDIETSKAPWYKQELMHLRFFVTIGFSMHWKAAIWPHTFAKLIIKKARRKI